MLLVFNIRKISPNEIQETAKTHLFGHLKLILIKTKTQNYIDDSKTLFNHCLLHW